MALGDRAAADASHKAFYALHAEFDMRTFQGMFPYRNPDTLKRFRATLEAAGLDRPPA